MAVSLDKFVANLRESGLFAREEFDALLAALPGPQKADGEQLARELVRRKKLTAYQAQEIYAGRGKKLLLGNYLIKDKLGQGGMGLVLKAEHRRMGRLVALKVMSAAALANPDAVKRFQREVQAAARLSHPNIVTAFDADEAGGTHFLVMEYVEGSDLASLVRNQGRLSAEKALHCILQAARGLEFAHSKGVIHRDIKPANLLLDGSGTVKVLDMGLARLEHDGAAAELTRSDEIMGTVDYMAPEQAANTRGADARADIYSLGMTLWFLLTGRTAFEGETMMAKLLAHQEQAIPSLMDHCPTATPAIEETFERMVAKRVEARFQTMTEVIAALERCRAASNLAVDAAPSIAAAPDEDSKLGIFLRRIAAGGTTANDPRYQPTLVTDHGQTDTNSPAVAPARSLAGPTGHSAPPKFEWWKSWPILAGAGLGSLALVCLAIWAIARGVSGNGVEPPKVATNPSRDPQKPSKPASPAPLPPVGPVRAERFEFVIRPDITWAEAKAEAERMGGHLAVITSREENDQVLKLVKPILVDGQHAWLGASCEERRGKWKWITGEPFSFTGWFGGEPNFDGTSGPWALTFRVRADNSLGWNDSSAASAYKTRGFVLERDAPTTQPAPGAPLASSHRYQFFRSPGITWLDAKATAERMGGHLATITSQPEAERVREILKTQLTATYQHCWLGASCDAKGGDWRWVTEEPFAFTAWAAGEPSYHGGAPWGLNYNVRPDKTLGWNDSSPQETVVASFTAGYLVEWEGPAPYDLLTSPNWKWSEPENLGRVVNSTVDDSGACLSADGLTLLFDSPRGGGKGERDLWMTRRGSLDDPWSPAENLGPGVNRASAERGPALSADELTLAFSRYISPEKGFDIRVSTRRTKEDAWGHATELWPAVNSPADEWNPHLSFDGLTLLLRFGRGEPGQGGSDLSIARRASRAEPFGVPENLGPPVNSRANEYDPHLSSDGRVLLFARTADIWISTRRSPADAWSQPALIAAPINSETEESHPTLSADGGTLVFQSRRAGGLGGWDLWLSRRVPK